jgi:hypothetical protein
MDTITDIEHGMYPSPNHKLSQADLKHLKFEMREGEYIVTLIDQTEYEIIKGYGQSIVDAINDLHSNLI